MKKFIIAMAYAIIGSILIIVLTSKVDASSISTMILFVMGVHFFTCQENVLYMRIFSVAMLVLGSGAIVYSEGINDGLGEFIFAYILYIGLLTWRLLKRKKIEV